LPDDILYLIFDEVYTHHYYSTDLADQVRIDQILINKRIAFLARPTWFAHLAIPTSQIDLRFAGVINDTNKSNKARRRNLRSLTVPVTNLFYNLPTFVIVSLPRLLSLGLLIAADAKPVATTCLADGIATLCKLEQLHLYCAAYSPMNDLVRRYISKKPDHTVDICLYVDEKLVWASRTRMGLCFETSSYGVKGLLNPLRVDWTKLFS